MEKDIGKLKKNDATDIIVRVDDFGGKPGVTIREFVTSEKYTGFTKAGTRIPADKFLDFRNLVNSINLQELTSQASSEKPKKEKKKKEEVVQTEEQEETEEI
jgi:hypothetical protein